MTSKGEQCGDCQLRFAPELLRVRPDPDRYGPFMNNEYINDKRCRFCWQDEKVNEKASRIQCPCCQRCYDKHHMKEKYEGYCGRCFESNAPKAKCDKCNNLDMGETKLCTKCRDASGETDKLVSEVTPLVLEKLYPDEPPKLYNVYGRTGWVITNARCPLEAYMKIQSFDIKNWIKPQVFSEFRNGPLFSNNQDRAKHYTEAIAKQLAFCLTEQSVKLATVV